MKESKPVLRCYSAFTLVELLIVIGIIALLLSVLVPTLRAARSQAQMTMCKSNMRQIFYGLTMYAADNRDRWPDAISLGRHPFRAAAGRTMPGRSSIPESYGLPALLHGLEPGKPPPSPLPKPRYLDGDSDVWICPNAPERITKWGNSYAWSLWEPLNEPNATPRKIRNPNNDAGTLQRHRIVINDPRYNEDSEQMRGGVQTFLYDNPNHGAGLTGMIGGGFNGTSGDDPYTFPSKLYGHVSYRKGYRGALNILLLNGEIRTQLVK